MYRAVKGTFLCKQINIGSYSVFCYSPWHLLYSHSFSFVLSFLMLPSQSQPVRQRVKLLKWLKFHHPKSHGHYLPQTFKWRQTFTHTAMQWRTSNTCMCLWPKHMDVALQWCKTWHVWFPWRLAVISNTLSCSFFSAVSAQVFCLRLTEQQAEGVKERVRKDKWDNGGKRKRGKNGKSGERYWTGLLRCFSFLLFLNCKPCVCVSVYKCVRVISIFKPRHRGWQHYSLPISPTDCTSAH